MEDFARIGTASENVRETMLPSLVEEYLRDWEFYWTMERGFEWMSSKCEVFTGLPADALLGFSFDVIESLVHPEDRAIWQSHLAESRNNIRDEFEIQFRMLKPSGEYLWVGHHCVPVCDVNGSFIGRRGSHRDITPYKQIEVVLENARADAEAATRAKTEFLSNMGHEIRTPLNGLLGSLQCLLDTELSSEQLELCRDAVMCGNRLASMLINIVDYTALEANSISFRKRLFSLRETLQEAVAEAEMRHVHENMQVDLQMDLGHDAVIGDQYRLRQVVDNILENAFKFTSVGAITIELQSMVVAPENTMSVLLVVSDTGCGIPEDKLAGICEPFSSVHVGLRKAYHGAGMGLALAYKLVLKMGGSMRIASREGQGTSVTFTLPFRMG